MDATRQTNEKESWALFAHGYASCVSAPWCHRPGFPPTRLLARTTRTKRGVAPLHRRVGLGQERERAPRLSGLCVVARERLYAGESRRPICFVTANAPRPLSPLLGSPLPSSPLQVIPTRVVRGAPHRASAFSIPLRPPSRYPRSRVYIDDGTHRRPPRWRRHRRRRPSFRVRGTDYPRRNLSRFSDLGVSRSTSDVSLRTYPRRTSKRPVAPGRRRGPTERWKSVPRTGREPPRCAPGEGQE